MHVVNLCVIGYCTEALHKPVMHLSIETPTTPPRAYVGHLCGGFLWNLKAWLAHGGGGFLRICLAYSWESMEVGERGGDLTRALFPHGNFFT